MRLSFSPLASQDLEAIGNYIAQENPNRALSFIKEIRVQCEKIAKHPLIYPSRTEFGAEIRFCPLRRYLIIFKPEETGVLIIRVLHGAMDVPAHMTQGNE